MTLEPTVTGSGTCDLRLLATSLAIVLLLAGCASYDGRGLVPGQSRAEDVQSLMGTPSEKITASGTPEEAKAKVAEYVKRGATCPILYPVGGNFKLLIDTFAQN